MISNKITERLHQYRYPTDNVYNLIANHTYYFNQKVTIMNHMESIKPKRLFNCCNNKVSKIETYNSSSNLPKMLQKDEWKIYELLNEKGYLSILYINEKTKQLILSFQGIKLTENDFKQDNETFIESLLVQKCIQTVYGLLHTKRAIDLSNEKNLSLSFTGYSVGAWLAEKSASYLFDQNLKKKPTKCVSFKQSGFVPNEDKLMSIINDLDKKSALDFYKLDIVSYLFILQ